MMTVLRRRMMTEYVNGIEQMTPEQKEILSKLQSESNKNYNLAVISLILSILAIIVTVIFAFIKF
jgi:hypothetical protein